MMLRTRAPAPPHFHIDSIVRVAQGLDTEYSTPYGSRDRKGETMPHTPIEREEAPRERTALPVRLALVDAGLSDPHACLDHLSHDLLEALDVYEHHIPLPAYGAARVIDSHVYTFSPADADTARTWASLCEQLHSDEHAGHARTPLLYAIACADEHGFIQARMALERLSSACRAADVPWGGGIAVGGGLLVSASVRSPRMGRMRRRRSEAIDMLIAAIRSSCSVNTLPNQNSSDLIIASCPVPRFLYAPICKACRHYRWE